MIIETHDLEKGGMLLRAAAEAGPGFRRTRRKLSPEERNTLIAQLKEAGEEPPVYLLADAEWIDRSAKLFEAGDYPDKGVSVTPEDLSLLSQGFDLPVPVLIEHSESPLQLGFLTDVEPRGHELYGTISLTKEANALVDQSGARGLSLGLSPNLRTIREVSLVRNPRVETARLFSCLVFSGELTSSPQHGESCEADVKPAQPSPPCSPSSPGRDDERASTSSQVRDWLREGRIVPSQVPFVQALLGTSDSIEFEGSKKPLRLLVIAMLERQPPHGLFSELVPVSNEEAAENLLLPEEAAFYKRHFPDVSLREIASRR